MLRLWLRLGNEFLPDLRDRRGAVARAVLTTPLKEVVSRVVLDHSFAMTRLGVHARAAEISISDFFPAFAISEISRFFLPTPAIYVALDCIG